MKRVITSIFRVWKREFHVVYADLGVMVFFFLLPFAYPIVYSAIYNPELARDVPVVVVDNSRTSLTREYVRHLDATQYLKVKGYAANMQEARRAMAEKECYGIVCFPQDFSQRVGRDEVATLELYCDMSLLLRYKSLLLAVTSVAGEMGTEIQVERLSDLSGASSAMEGMPIPYKLEPVGNESQGLASALLPGILVLILQQSVILAICFLGATSRERAKSRGGVDPMQIGAGVLSTMIGKALCYFVIMLVPTIFLVHFVPIIFSFPMNGDVVDLIVFFVPYLLAVIFFGMMIQQFVPDRESTMLVFVFSSIVFIFLSGISWPRYAMSVFWQLVGDLVPSTWAITGFVGINTLGAELSQQSHAYVMLWGLAVAYFAVSYILMRCFGGKRKA